jgi:N-methylhydantoinase A
MAHAVAVDIGGTFTDLVAYDHDRRSVVYTKSLTTYGNLVEGVLDCFLKAKLDPRAAHFVNHGTRMTNSGLIQIGPELEESALMSGGNAWDAFARISVPLLAPTLLYMPGCRSRSSPFAS